MPDRALLHRSKLEDFKEWLVEDGWSIVERAGIYEEVRAFKAGRKHPLIVYTRVDGFSEHLTVRGMDYSVVRAYIRQRRRENCQNIKE